MVCSYVVFAHLGTWSLWLGLRNLSFATRRGSSKDTRGTAYIVYEDIYDAKNAVDHLSGFNVANRYLIVLYYNTAKHSKKVRGRGMLACCPARYAFAEFRMYDSSTRCLQDKAALISAVLFDCFALSGNPHLADGTQVSTKDKEDELRKMQEKYGVDGTQQPRQQK